MTMHLQLDAFLLLDARQGVEPLLSFTQCPDSESALKALCQGLEANALWCEFDEAHLVARAAPEPLLAVFGRFTHRQRALLENLAAELNDVINRHRYVGYADAEDAAATLAATLISRFGRAGLDSFRFTAIPRGGWIVLGMLSYCLGLRHDQIGVPGDPLDQGELRTWVVVDDCTLSGVRFRQFLTSRDLRSVIFCPLYAPAELCDAIQRAEPGVEACLNAVDLQDVAPERFGKAYPQWLEQRRARVGEKGYWLGIPEHVAFAWCETQSKYWDNEMGCYRASWSLLPPSLSLNRQQEAERLRSQAGAGGAERTALLVPGGGAVQEAPRVLWTDFDGSIALARFPDDPDATAPCFRLEGSAAEMWCCVLEHGTLEGAEAALLERYNVDLPTLRHDLTAFVVELEKNGFLICR
ncbi:PqqD family protein [Halomonas alkalisoli]|uniref:PqqD family protein n=1 Tax=Halomonas alkalisoli TaxID=2907158 RepID=UPI001F25A379|nr:PqqD family protein [Halomonas alkalisoli]MCE9683108.1 PqqD family protein [Halomonas alkalisoli]